MPAGRPGRPALPRCPEHTAAPRRVCKRCPACCELTGEQVLVPGPSGWPKGKSRDGEPRKVYPDLATKKRAASKRAAERAKMKRQKKASIRVAHKEGPR